MYPIQHIAHYGNELMWLIAGILVGMMLMAIIDFIIDRTTQKKIELTVYRNEQGKTLILNGDWSDK